MQAQPAITRSLLKPLIALLVFLFVCGSLSLPLLCVGGEVSGRSKTALVFLVFCRLAWQIYRGSFRFRDYFIYFAVVVAFCFWLDSYL
jgi:hypothetical protein